MKLPRTRIELDEIYTYLHGINALIVTRYYDELKEISEISKKEVDSYWIWMKEQEEAAIKNPTPFQNVNDQIEKRMKEKNISE